ncbi:GGDEF domain-containing protein [Hydrogenovibrio kuenenii]|uniref:GGDEF domain-containing protein n=1 Tax=Hydrogenovibrio kuenenii TaxID=63658 RepID=UPI000464C8CC|nr:GGDEF domain-containing protein [Hydrogenovibrio kuenenii]
MTHRSTREIIDDLYEKFYQELLSEPHYAVFFEKQNINSIKQKQAQSLFDLLSLSDEEIHENGLLLGKIHVNIGLPFEDLYAGYHKLQQLIPLYFDEYWLANHQLFRRLSLQKDAVAKGYLISYIEQLKQEIDTTIDKRRLLLRANFSELANYPLVWFQEILVHLSDKKNPLPEMDHNLCSLTDQLVNHTCLKESERAELLHTHTVQHIMGNNFLFFVNHKEYTLAVFLLSRFYGLTLDLSNRIGLAFQMSFIQELQKDPLTHFYLRHDMESLIEEVLQISVTTKRNVAIVMLDLDDFKQINDLYGHLAGDNVLKEISELFAQIVRESDKIFRYGGEEFLILLDGANIEVAATISERLRKLIEEHDFSINETVKMHITASIGIAAYHPSMMEKVPSARHFIDTCDRMLLRAKRNGKNRIEYC